MSNQARILRAVGTNKVIPAGDAANGKGRRDCVAVTSEALGGTAASLCIVKGALVSVVQGSAEAFRTCHRC